jgi:phosphatidylglycerol:prolipoprotein diacylglycerol transferase
VHPILIDLGRHELPFLGEKHLFLPTYGFLFALSVLIGWWWFMRRARSLDLPEDKLFNLVFYSLLAGIVGAKLLLILVDWRTFLLHPREILGTLRSAGVLVGGVIAASATFYLYGKSQGLPVHRLGDAIAAPMALAQGIGRLGCHAAGCCWGVVAGPNNPIAVIFTDPEATLQTGVPLNVARVPTQLIQMTNDLLLALFLTWLWRRRPQPAGTVFWIYVLLYSIGRGVIELWRGDSNRGLYFGELISTSQLFALAGMVLSTAMLLRGLVQRRQAASA